MIQWMERERGGRRGSEAVLGWWAGELLRAWLLRACLRAAVGRGLVWGVVSPPTTIASSEGALWASALPSLFGRSIRSAVLPRPRLSLRLAKGSPTSRRAVVTICRDLAHEHGSKRRPRGQRIALARC